MGTAVEDSLWATKAEATAQQARRFSQRRDPDPLPPLLRAHRPATPPPPLPREHHHHQQHLTAAGHGPPAALPRPRANTAEADRPTADSTTTTATAAAAAAIPSLSALNRDFDRLSRAYAGARGDAPVAIAAAATHCAGRSARRTSAPTAVPRVSEVPVLPPVRLPSSSAVRRPESEVPSRKSGADLRTPSPFLPAVAASSRVATPEAADATTATGVGDVSLTSPSRGEGEEAPPSAAAADATPSPLQGRSRSIPAPPSASPAPQGKGKSRDGRIRVVVRKRPLAASEEGPDCVQVSGPHLRLAVTKQRVDLSSYEESSDYTFDHAFDANATNADVYATAVADLLTVSLAGGSASCFAYGQTGSGKTFTMMGTESECGLYLLAAGDLFSRLQPRQQLCVCFYEIYCNSLFDLLNRRHPIVLREDANRRVNLCGVVWRTVTTVDELWWLMRTGMEQRRTGSTSANEHSSRSHAILSIRITDAADSESVGMVNFVDLAGSERAADTAANDRLTRLEGAEINKSLLALKECIRALDERRKHVPFRGSRLTEVLRDSFTGNSKTVMIATVSPSSHNYEHTNNTLRYAFRVKGLSIASVAPSKARNLPRPYIPTGRSKSTAGQVDEAHASPAPTRHQLQQQQRAKRRRRLQRGHSSNAEDDAASTTAMDELTAIADVRARRASRQRRRGSNNTDLADLLPDDYRDEGRGVQRKGQRAVHKAPPATPFSLNSPRSSASSTLYTSHRGNVVPLPPIVAVSSPLSSDVVMMDVAVLERRLTHQIMSQLRQDLGRQLEDVLGEKEATINALRDENASLRKALERAQREAAQSDRSLSAQEVYHRSSGGLAVPAAIYPTSPSILQEEASSGASVSSDSEDAAFHVV